MAENEVFNDFAPEQNSKGIEEEFWKVLVVDDKEDVHKTTEFALKNFTYKGKGIKLLRAFNNLSAKHHLDNNPDVAVVLLDVVMDENGLKLIPYIRDNAKTKYVQIILRTGEPDEAPEREVVEKFEINDYIAKPDATQDRLFTSITASLRAYKHLIKLERQQLELERMNNLLKNDNQSLKEISVKQETVIEKMKEELISKELENRIGNRFIGVSSQIRKVKDMAMNIARFNECVLISGENGSGKEIIAHLIHHASDRKNNNFLAFNCTAIAENLVESVLFGYKKGAFTGAVKDHNGYFKSADKGTLFIDEIGEMDLAVQVKLLRAIEYSEFIPIGAEKQERADVRIIAATNKDLAQLVKEGRFREDLYYRINTSNVVLPPLRDRRDDIEPLIEYFSEAFALKYNVLNPGISREAISLLKNYRFPGNVRELKNIIFNALINSNGEELQAEDFASLGQKKSFGLSGKEDFSLASALLEAKKNAINRAKDLSETGKVEDICRLLDVPRANYYRYIKEIEDLI